MVLYDLYELNDDHNIGCWKENKISYNYKRGSYSITSATIFLPVVYSE